MSPRARLLLVVAGLVFLPLLGWGVFNNPWRRLQAAYGTPVDTGGFFVRWTVSFTDARRAFWSRHENAVATRFLDDRIELWQRSPLHLLYGSLRIPARAVSRCARFTRDVRVASAALWLEREGQWLVFESGSDVALEWCRAHGLAIADDGNS